MPALTIQTIRDNPWNVTTHMLPSNPDKLLLRIALLAAEYCWRSEQMLMSEARHGGYVPAGWQADGERPDIHEESEELSIRAFNKFENFTDLYERLFGPVDS